MIEIKHRFTGEVIATGETIAKAVADNLADLRGADLGGAYLSGAYLRGADLRDAKLAWRSHDLLAEILRRAAGDDIGKLKVAGLVLIQRDWCWREMLKHADRDPLGGWALDELRQWVQDGDEVPEVLQKEGEAA